ELAQIALEFDALIAEGPVMIAVGKYLGQELAPKGKMPKPVPTNPAVALQALKQMSSVTRVTNKKGKFMPVVQVVLGTEAMDDKQLAENAVAVVNAVQASLPGKAHNIKSVLVKESMGPAMRVGSKGAQ
ncbi:MAG: 50S ribosomal protein L1, partial [archaeon]|nr:50S ribosomal protein L1 [archaeon]